MLPHPKSSMSFITKKPYTGIDLLRNPASNKGTAFTEEERDQLGIRGLLPPRVNTQEQQVLRVMNNVHSKSSDLEKYIFLIALQDRNETLFYRVILDHLEELMPIIYTPTVGRACQDYAHIFRRPQGVFISANDRGKMGTILENWRHKNVRVIVVTDGERILGLGDLGANGMGIPVGKLSLYTACAGIHPSICLPVTIDAGTENEELLRDPLYIGLQQRRVRGDAYFELIEEFVGAAQRLFPDVLIQFEDFANHNAFQLLNKYRNRVCAFNDDIQGTASVALAGLYSALRISRKRLGDQKIVFFGAGEAGTGTAELVVDAMMQEGLSKEQALATCWFIDSKGLVVKSRTDLAEHKLPYAQNYESMADPLSIIEALKPTALIGASGQAGTFTEPILRRMAELNARPIIFALSNPTSKTECTAEEAYRCTDGRAIYVSGSPFAPVEIHGRKFIPGQGNNVYIFPGLGLGITVSRSRLVTNEMFLAAARTLANQVSQADLDAGRIFPPLTKIREVSFAIALTTAEIAWRSGLAAEPEPRDLAAHIAAQIYEPVYDNYALGDAVS